LGRDAKHIGLEAGIGTAKESLEFFPDMPFQVGERRRGGRWSPYEREERKQSGASLRNAKEATRKRSTLVSV